MQRLKLPKLLYSEKAVHVYTPFAVHDMRLNNLSICRSLFPYTNNVCMYLSSSMYSIPARLSLPKGINGTIVALTSARRSRNGLRRNTASRTTKYSPGNDGGMHRALHYIFWRPQVVKIASGQNVVVLWHHLEHADKRLRFERSGSLSSPQLKSRLK